MLYDNRGKRAEKEYVERTPSLTQAIGIFIAITLAITVIVYFT